MLFCTGRCLSYIEPFLFDYWVRVVAHADTERGGGGACWGLLRDGCYHTTKRETVSVYVFGCDHGKHLVQLTHMHTESISHTHI